MNNSKELGFPPAQGDFNEGDIIKSNTSETGENRTRKHACRTKVGASRVKSKHKEIEAAMEALKTQRKSTHRRTQKRSHKFREGSARMKEVFSEMNLGRTRRRIHTADNALEEIKKRKQREMEMCKKKNQRNKHDSEMKERAANLEGGQGIQDRDERNQEEGK